MRRQIPTLMLLGAVCAGLVTACSSPAPSTSGPTPSDAGATIVLPEAIGPGMSAFHTSLPATTTLPPGTIVASEPFVYRGVPDRAWRVAYSSRSIDDRPIVVTGLVIVPTGVPPAGGWPILTWAHGTTGIGDLCAPSADTSRSTPAQGVLDAGFAFVATDYEGLGTIGRHPYLVGASEARSTLDIALAASRVPEWRTSRNVAVWGHSQGGHAALFTTTLAERYSPEITVVAVVAGAPASGLDEFARNETTAALRPFSILVALSFNGIDPERAPLDAALSPAGVDLALRSTQACNTDLHAAVAALAPGTVLTKNPPSDDWLALLRANDPMNITTPSSVPTLIIHGSDDDLIPAANSRTMLGRYCAIGRPTELWIGEGTDHSTVVSSTFPSMMRWISARVAAPVPVNLPPSVTRSTC